MLLSALTPLPPFFACRPQHGLFGLLEWVQDGSLPLWQPEFGETALAPPSSVPNYAPTFPCGGILAGLASTTSAGFGRGSSSMAVLPLAEAAAVAVTPAKRGPPEGGNQKQRRVSDSFVCALPHPGEPHRARRARCQIADAPLSSMHAYAGPRAPQKGTAHQGRAQRWQGRGVEH